MNLIIVIIILINISLSLSYIIKSSNIIKKSSYILKSTQINDNQIITTTTTAIDKINNEEEEKSIPVTWHASVKSSAKVQEKNRKTEEYMKLPPSEYSVLTAEQIVRINDSQFKCILPTMNFFGEKITPVLYVDVIVYPDEARSEILVSKAETIGSATAEKVNGTFSIRAMNEVTTGVDYKNRKILTSNTNLKIDVLIPKDSKVPRGLIQSGGNFIMQSSLNIIVPTFVRLLAFDFNRWTEGDNSRSAVDGAKLSL